MRAAWEESNLYVLNRNPIHLLDDLEKEISRAFDDSEMRDVLKVCIDRDTGYIEQYLANRFEFDLVSEPEPEPFTEPESEAEEDQTANGEEPDLSESTASSITLSKEESDETNEYEIPPESSDDPLPPDEPSDTEPGPKDEIPDFEDSRDEPEQPFQNERDLPTKPKTDPRRKAFNDHLKEQGYVFAPGGDLYLRGDGSSVRKKTTPMHWWEETDSKGDIVCRYWFAPKSLRDGLEMPAELWTLLDQNPDTYQIIEPLDHEEATVTPATEIVDGIHESTVKLYPTRYLIREETN